MAVNLVSLTSSILNINTPSAQGLILNKGEVVKGVVQEVKTDGNLVLLIQGKLLEAFSEVPMEKGQQVHLLVDDFREGRTYLKIMTPEGLNHLTDDKIVSNLKTMGVNSGSDSLDMAKKLMQYNIPVTRETLNELSRGIKTLGGFNPRNLEIAVVSLAGGAPSEPATLTALAQYFNNENDLGQIFESLAQILDDPELAVQQLTNPEASIPQESEQAPVDSGAPSIESPPLETSTEPQGIAMEEAIQPSLLGNDRSVSAHLPSLPIEQSLPENSVNNQIFSIIYEESGAQSSTKELPQGYPQAVQEPLLSSPIFQPSVDEPIKQQAAALLKDLLQTLLIDSKDPSPTTARKMQTRPQDTRDLVKGLVLLKDMLRSADNGKGLVHELLENLDHLEKEISGQQAANYLGKNPGVQEQQECVYYLAFPAQMGTEYQQVQLRIQRDASRQPLAEADHLSLVVALNTSNMGQVLFHVDWSQLKKLSIRGVVENEGVCQHLEENLETLLNSLRAMGYSVENQGVRISEVGLQAEQLKWKLAEKRADVPVCRVDITV